jgi:hypothetical protein
MVRSRSSRSEETPESNNGSTNQSELICPECGRSFTRAAALGAHRRAAHGIAGAKAAARKRPRQTGPRGRRATARVSRGTTGAGRSTARAQSDGVDRDALLSALFPNGIPPRQDLIRSLNAWLEEAERLAKLR